MSKAVRSRGTTTSKLGAKDEIAKSPRRQTARRCNSLDGKRWLQNSISVWSDIRKSADELRLKHPAMFPAALAERLIETFLPAGRHVILDPFAGTGSTLVAAEQLGKEGIGLELSGAFVTVTLQRLARRLIEVERTDGAIPHATGNSTVYEASARDIGRYVSAESVDLCVTSPPYWNILNQRRTADGKGVRNYGNLPDDLGTIALYEDFLDALVKIFEGVLHVLKPGAHCCVVVMDLRKKDRFYPFHSDLAGRLQRIGFVWDDLILWNRQSEYNNLRPLGYPAVFRVNKVHEYVVLMQKPRQ